MTRLMRQLLFASFILIVFAWCAAALYFDAPPELSAVLVHERASKEYVGSEQCGSCHAKQVQSWKTSDHYQSMLEANEESVLGDFSDVDLEFHSVNSKMARDDDGRYFVDTSGPQGETERFEIKYTFGFYPLQQYLVELENGFIQALNIAWDSRTEQEGGQRWFHLREDLELTPEHPFYWTRHFQNWNSRCAECHSTNIEKNYSLKDHSYNTTWSEINVACEACHGPASQHLTLAASNQLTEGNLGFDSPLHQPLQWQFDNQSAIASHKGKSSERDINMCGRCHSLSTRLTEALTNEGFHQNNRLQLPTPPSYYVDGQIREEVFVLGSFLQSKMYAAGVTCTNCHDPHNNKLIMEGNDLCSQCHNREVFDTEKHHHHPINSEGAQCVNCHMPENTYMQVDKRRDHSFTIPRPDVSLALDVPNACTECHGNKEKGVHNGKDNQWASDQLAKWGAPKQKKHWAHLNHRAQIGDVTVTSSIVKSINEEASPDIVRAALLQALAQQPSPQSLELARHQLKNKNPMIRRGAVSAMQNLPANMRWELLSQYLHDENRSVRFEVMQALADVLNQLPQSQRNVLLERIDEYQKILSLTADSPASQLAIANLNASLGYTEAAEKSYLQALRIEANFVPALLNLADFYRATERESKVDGLLKKALNLAPGSNSVHHSYGLYWVRMQDYTRALDHLKRSTQGTDAIAHYAYVYAVALDSLGKTSEAINQLIAANQRWPKHYSLLTTLIAYLEKMGETADIEKYTSELQAISR